MSRHGLANAWFGAICPGPTDEETSVEGIEGIEVQLGPGRESRLSVPAGGWWALSMALAWTLRPGLTKVEAKQPETVFMQGYSKSIKYQRSHRLNHTLILTRKPKNTKASLHFGNFT